MYSHRTACVPCNVYRGKGLDDSLGGHLSGSSLELQMLGSHCAQGSPACLRSNAPSVPEPCYFL